MLDNDHKNDQMERRKETKKKKARKKNEEAKINYTYNWFNSIPETWEGANRPFHIILIVQLYPILPAPLNRSWFD